MDGGQECVFTSTIIKYLDKTAKSIEAKIPLLHASFYSI